MKWIIFIAFLIIIPFSLALDSQTLIPCGGDSQLLVGCIGDQQDIIYGGDIVSPTISLTSPEPNTQDTDGVVIFSYIPSDGNDIANCSLNYQGGTYITSNSITRGIANLFEITGVTGNHPLSKDNLKWYISCTDIFNNIGVSEVRNLDTKEDYSSAGGGSSNLSPKSISVSYPSIWYRGSKTSIEISAFNQEDNLYLPANITLKYDNKSLELYSIKSIDKKTEITFNIPKTTILELKSINISVIDERTIEKQINFTIQDKPINEIEPMQLIKGNMLISIILILVISGIFIVLSFIWDYFIKKKSYMITIIGGALIIISAIVLTIEMRTISVNLIALISASIAIIIIIILSIILDKSLKIRKGIISTVTLILSLSIISGFIFWDYLTASNNRFIIAGSILLIELIILIALIFDSLKKQKSLNNTYSSEY